MNLKQQNFVLKPNNTYMYTSNNDAYLINSQPNPKQTITPFLCGGHSENNNTYCDIKMIQPNPKQTVIPFLYNEHSENNNTHCDIRHVPQQHKNPQEIITPFSSDTFSYDSYMKNIPSNSYIKNILPNLEEIPIAFDSDSDSNSNNDIDDNNTIPILKNEDNNLFDKRYNCTQSSKCQLSKNNEMQFQKLREEINDDLKMLNEKNNENNYEYKMNKKINEILETNYDISFNDIYEYLTYMNLCSKKETDVIQNTNNENQNNMPKQIFNEFQHHLPYNTQMCEKNIVNNVNFAQNVTTDILQHLDVDKIRLWKKLKKQNKIQHPLLYSKKQNITGYNAFDNNSDNDNGNYVDYNKFAQPINNNKISNNTKTSNNAKTTNSAEITKNISDLTQNLHNLYESTKTNLTNICDNKYVQGVFYFACGVMAHKHKDKIIGLFK